MRFRVRAWGCNPGNAAKHPGMAVNEADRNVKRCRDAGHVPAVLRSCLFFAYLCTEKRRAALPHPTFRGRYAERVT